MRGENGAPDVLSYTFLAAADTKKGKCRKLPTQDSPQHPLFISSRPEGQKNFYKDNQYLLTVDFLLALQKLLFLIQNNNLVNLDTVQEKKMPV